MSTFTFSSVYFCFDFRRKYFCSQRASEQFSVLKRQGKGGESREDVLKKTAAAFDKYEELLAHLQVGRI